MFNRQLSAESRRRLAALLLATSLLLPGFAAAGGFSLTILHTNDLHSRFQPMRAHTRDLLRGGFAHLYAEIKHIRRGKRPVLFLNAGDLFQGSVFFHRFRGKLGIELLNRMRLDAMVLGNHEFDLGWSQLRTSLRLARFPLLAANLKLSVGDPLRRRLVPWTIVKRNGRRIGIIGLLTPERHVYNQMIPLSIGDPIAAARKAVKQLKRKGVDAIIALTHLGVGLDKKLARSVAGIDIIVGGHGHSRVVGLWVPGPGGRNVLVVQAGSKGRYLGRIDARFDTGGRLNMKKSRSRLIPIIAQPGHPGFRTPAPEIKRIIDAAARKLRHWITLVLGHTKVDLGQNRLRQSRMGSLVCRSMLWGTRQYKTRIALLNSGAIRRGLLRGPVRLGDLIEALPYDNRLVVLDLSGAHLRRLLEHGISIINPPRPRGLTGQFLQVAGLKLKFDSRRPLGKRVVALQVFDGRAFRPFSATARYRVVVPDFIHVGGDGFSFRGAVVRYRSSLPLRKVVRGYLKLKKQVQPRLDGRSRDLNPSTVR